MVLSFIIILIFAGVFTYFQIQENNQAYRQNKMHEKEMQQAENERLEEVRQRSILRHNLTSSRVNPEKDYPDALTDQSVILHLAQKRLQKPDCQSSFDMRYLPVIRGYVSYDEVQNPTVESKQKLKTALAEYKENAFSYKAIHWALSGYPKG